MAIFVRIFTVSEAFIQRGNFQQLALQLPMGCFGEFARSHRFPAVAFSIGEDLE
jgi:hypothetical protein